VVVYRNWRDRLPPGNFSALRWAAFVPYWRLDPRPLHDDQWCDCALAPGEIYPTMPDLALTLTPSVGRHLRSEKYHTPEGPRYRSFSELRCPLPDDPGRQDEARVRRFLQAVLPGRSATVPFVPVDPHTDGFTQADVEAQAKHFQGRGGIGEVWVIVEPNAQVTGQVQHLARADRIDGTLSLDVVDVLVPVYAMLCALRSGAHHELIGPGARRGWRRVGWRLRLHGRVLSGPRPASSDIVFPGRRPRQRMSPLPFRTTCASFAAPLVVGMEPQRPQGITSGHGGHRPPRPAVRLGIRTGPRRHRGDPQDRPSASHGDDCDNPTHTHDARAVYAGVIMLAPNESGESVGWPIANFITATTSRPDRAGEP
jgi:hypothetical protein